MAGVQSILLCEGWKEHSLGFPAWILSQRILYLPLILTLLLPSHLRIIQYVWFFVLNFLYSMVLIGIGTAVDLAIFRLTSYSYLVVRGGGGGPPARRCDEGASADGREAAQAMLSARCTICNHSTRSTAS